MDEMINGMLANFREEDIDALYAVFTNLLMGNDDFHLAMKDEEDDSRLVVEEMVRKPIPASFDELLLPEEEEVLREIRQYAHEEKEPGRDRQQELLVRVLESDTLLEGVCLGFFGSDEDLSQMMTACGCGARYRLLAEDPVYKKRRAFVQTISRYAMAATNLYGVVSLKEFMEFVERFEKSLKKTDGYIREVGNYRDTILFSPQWWCPYTAHHIVGNLVPTVVVTLDAFLANQIFADELRQENEKFVEYFKDYDREITEKDLDKFYSSLKGIAYRELYKEANQKQIYLPSKKEFLRYAEQDYYEESLAEKALKKRLREEKWSCMELSATECGFTPSECLDLCMREIHWAVGDHYPKATDNPTAFVENALRILNDYHVEPADMEELNSWVDMVVKVANSVRLWKNHGLTPNELGMSRRKK